MKKTNHCEAKRIRQRDISLSNPMTAAKKLSLHDIYIYSWYANTMHSLETQNSLKSVSMYRLTHSATRSHLPAPATTLTCHRRPDLTEILHGSAWLLLSCFSVDSTLSAMVTRIIHRDLSSLCKRYNSMYLDSCILSKSSRSAFLLREPIYSGSGRLGKSAAKTTKIRK